MNDTQIKQGSGSYTANLLGNIRSHLAGLQGYDVMALELIQNADDAKAEEIPANVSADAAYQNAMKNNAKKTARIKHDAALQRVMIDLLADHTELFKQFSDNPSFKKWLGDTIFGVTYQQQSGHSATGESNGR